MTAPIQKTCSIPNCTRQARSRGMCNSHYTTWRRKTTIDTTPVSSESLVLEVLPGTIRELAVKAGLCYETVRKIVRSLHERRAIHVEDQTIPCVAGGHYSDVFAIGDGEDFKLPKQTKRQYALRGRRIKHHANRAARTADPLVAALFGSGVRVPTMTAEG